MKFDTETLCPRRAGQVTRYHTWPRLREQSVGEHTWQLMRILLAVWPGAPRHVLAYAVFHDVEEVATGDVPYPVKKDNPALSAAYGTMEAEVRVGLAAFGVPKFQALSSTEKIIFKMCEFLEMWEWGLHEQNLGNAYARLVADRCLVAAYGKLDELGEHQTAETDAVAARFHDYVDRRQKYEEAITGGKSA